MRSSPTEKIKYKTNSAIHEPVQATPTPKTTPAKLVQMVTPHQPAVIEDELERRTYTPLPKSPNSKLISQEALAAFTATVWGTSPENFIPQSMRWDEHKINTTIKLEHFCAPFVHPVSGEIISIYQTLAWDPVTKETWTTAWGKEWVNLAQGDEKKHSRDRLTVRDDTQRDTECFKGLDSDIRTNGGRLPPTETRSQPSPHQGRGISHQIPRWANYADCGPDHIKSIVGQCVKHTRRKMHVHWYQKKFTLATHWIDLSTCASH